MRESIQAKVRADLEARERLGIEQYGAALYSHNGRDALQDAYEEALDLCCYLRQAIEERGGPELPHGIPEGENDKGWPDGTPESVTKGSAMSEPYPEVVAAALALAEADSFHYANKDSKAAHDAHMQSLEAYRAAIAPKRTPSLTLEQRVARLERASEMAPYMGKIKAQREIRDDVERPAREETAPEPAERQRCEVSRFGGGRADLCAACQRHEERNRTLLAERKAEQHKLGQLSRENTALQNDQEEQSKRIRELERENARLMRERLDVGLQLQAIVDDGELSAGEIVDALKEVKWSP
jgi:hypothetical protein